MRRKRGQRDYLFQRSPGSNWWIKLQTPGNRVERSLGTTDRREAELAALPLIAQHKASLLALRPTLTSHWDPAIAPGLYVDVAALERLEDEDCDPEHWGPIRSALEWVTGGGRVFATDRELHFLDGEGKTTRTAPNGGTANFYTGPIRLGGLSEAINQRPTVTTRSGDDAILETYLELKGANKYARRGAEDTWATFRSLTGGKPLVKCGWDDGRKLVKHYEAKGLKSASIHKRLVRLSAAVRHAIKTGKLPTTMINPFSAVVPKVGQDATKKVRLSETDITKCRKNLHLLKPEDQLLFRFLCSTGARLGEAFQVVDEETAEGTNIRYCEVGTKTAASHRRIPFPECLLPHLPPVITGPLFKGDPAAASTRLNVWLHDVCGINEKDEGGAYVKTVHSLRHRAVEILDEAEIPDSVSRRLFGHTQDEHSKYSKAVKVLKKWVDKIDGI